MKIEEKSALLVIDIQQEDFKEMDENNMEAPEWNCIRNAKKVLDIFRAKKLPVIQIKGCIGRIWWILGGNWMAQRESVV